MSKKYDTHNRWSRKWEIGLRSGVWTAGEPCPGKKVIIVQFLKGVLRRTGSLEILERAWIWRSRGFGFEHLPDAILRIFRRTRKKEETMNLRNGFNFAKKVMATGECATC